MPDVNFEELANNDKVMEKRFAKLGEEFFHSLFATLKTASLYEANNNRYIKQVQELRMLIAEVFTEDRALSFNYKDGFFFLNSFRISPKATDEEATRYFSEKFKSFSIDGFEINPQADAREIDKFIYCLTHFKPDDDPDEAFQMLKERLDKLNIENIFITILSDGESEKKDEEKKDKSSKVKARKVFFQAIGVVQDIINQAQTGSKVNLTKTKRVVQSMVDQIIDDEPAMMELTVLRDHDQYTYVHSVNVCVLSLILGYHLKLDKRRLSDLGVGALLHDVGKIDLPASLINKAETFDELDWEQMKMHPVYGVKSIIRSRGTDRSSVRAIAAAYEHHITFTGGGYPALLQKRTPCLFAQIVSICDSFNAMTSGRVYHKKRMTGDEVVTNLVNRAGTDFNPLLVKVFINITGIYPVGSVVRLNSDEVAIVTRTNPDNLESPEVKVIANKDGKVGEVKIVDLSKEAADGVRIQSIIDGEKYNIDPADFIDLG